MISFGGDALSFANHPDVKTLIWTPWLRMVSFSPMLIQPRQAVSPHGRLMTGRSQKRHGRVGYLDEVEWRYQHYMAEEFSNSGYQTQCIGKMHVHPPRLTCGFQNLQLHDGYLAVIAA